MSAPQFPSRPRKPGRNDPVSAQELMRKCEAWAHLVSQLDDHRIAGNQRGVLRTLTRLARSTENLRERYAIHGEAQTPEQRAEWLREYQRRVTERS